MPLTAEEEPVPEQPRPGPVPPRPLRARVGCLEWGFGEPKVSGESLLRLPPCQAFHPHLGADEPGERTQHLLCSAGQGNSAKAKLCLSSRPRHSGFSVLLPGYGGGEREKSKALHKECAVSAQSPPISPLRGRLEGKQIFGGRETREEVVGATTDTYLKYLLAAFLPTTKHEEARNVHKIQFKA